MISHFKIIHDFLKTENIFQIINQEVLPWHTEKA